MSQTNNIVDDGPLVSTGLSSASGRNSDQILDQIQDDVAGLDAELPNIALEAEELATLSDLIARYDQVLKNLDSLNDQIENLLSEESIKGCDS